MSTDVILAALAWLGTYLVHSTLLLGTVLLIARKRAHAQPRLVERMWKVAALGGILTATLQVSLVSDPLLGSLSLRSIVIGETHTARTQAPPEGSEPGATPSQRTQLEAPARMTEPGATEARSAPARERRELPARRPRRARGAPDTTLTAVMPLTPRADEPFADQRSSSAPPAGPSIAGQLGSEQARAPGEPLPWRPAVVTTWVIVGGWGLLGFLFAWSRLFARLSDRRVLKSGLLVDRLADLCRRAGVNRRIRLTASSSIDSPITHGWFRREICVPERALIELSPSQLESTLAHELAHVLRRDPLWFGTLALLERVLFFQPLNRIARRELQEIAELVCDDWAVRWTGGRLALASALTEIAHWIVGRRQLALPSPGMASSRLSERVERLLDDRLARTPEPTRAWLPPTALGALGLIVLAVPGVTSAAPAITQPRETREADRSADETPEHLRFDFAPRGELTSAPRTDLGLRTDQELLDDELRLLRAELADLRRELGETGLYGRFEHAFEKIEGRIDDLQSRKERLNALLSRVLLELDQDNETH